MNRSKIEWCDHTWNPITGCLHGCEYCYARRMVARFAGDVRLNKMCTADYRKAPLRGNHSYGYILDKPMKNEDGNTIVYPFGFEPTFHRYRLDMMDKLKMGNNIFVGAMADIFGDWVPDGWLDEIFDTCRRYPIHNYLFLTKNPERYTDYLLRELYRNGEYENFWFGTSATRKSEMPRIEFLPEYIPFVSFEPLLEDVEPENDRYFRKLAWVIIGAETGNSRNKVIPRPEWIEKLVVEADKWEIPVFMKDSLVSVVGERNMRRDYPAELLRKTMSQKMHNKLYDVCYKCGKQMKKSDMVTLLARSRRGQQPKQYGFMCWGCFENFCKSTGIEIPDIRKEED